MRFFHGDANFSLLNSNIYDNYAKLLKNFCLYDNWQTHTLYVRGLLNNIVFQSKRILRSERINLDKLVSFE